VVPCIHIPDAEEETKRVSDFYLRNPSDFIFPRSQSDLEQLATDAALFATSVGTQVVAACYMKALDTGSDYELGGILVDPSARGQGLAAVTAATALASVIVMAQPDTVLAHVHELNQMPQALLSKLGLVETTRRDILSNPPPTMRKNDRGEVVGVVYEFDWSRIEELGTRMRVLQGDVDGGRIRFEVGLLQPNELAQQLAQRRAKQ
jgi:GNAT superfamily N-acetyltransferase